MVYENNKYFLELVTNYKLKCQGLYSTRFFCNKGQEYLSNYAVPRARVSSSVMVQPTLLNMSKPT